MDASLLHRVDGLLREKRDAELRSLLLNQHPRTLADIIDELDRGKRKAFATLHPEIQADVLMLLSDASIASVLPRLTDFTIARLLHFMDEDNATDIMGLLPEKRHRHILEHVKGERKKRIEKLLTFDPETAGGLMDLNFLEVSADQSAAETIEALKAYTVHHKHVPSIFVRGPKGIEWIPSRILISSSGTAQTKDIAKQIPSILHSTDREKVLKIIDKENSDIACVVDDHGKIIGVIQLNDLLRVAKSEASEDLYRMGAVGLLSASYLESDFTTIWRKRIGWLLFLFIAELFTFTALSRFESSIDAVTVLALFVPLCISTGGNSGSQAATLITRAMALGHVKPSDWWKVLRRELFMGVALGLALGTVGYARALLTPAHVLGEATRWTLAIVIAISVSLICIWGTLVGSMLPLAFKKLGFDPGYASSPFVATFVDVTGIVIYFSIANALILNAL